MITALSAIWNLITQVSDNTQYTLLKLWKNAIARHLLIIGSIYQFLSHLITTVLDFFVSRIQNILDQINNLSLDSSSLSAQFANFISNLSSSPLGGYLIEVFNFHVLVTSSAALISVLVFSILLRLYITVIRAIPFV